MRGKIGDPMQWKAPIQASESWMGAAHSILQCLALSLPEERRDGSAQSPKREIGASSHCATGGQQANRSWLGCSPTGATSAIAGIDVIGIHGDGGIQGYYSPTSDVGAVIQRNALVRDNAPIEVSGCPQGRRTANLPVDMVIAPWIDDEHRRSAGRGQRAPNLEDDHHIVQAFEIEGELSGHLC